MPRVTVNPVSERLEMEYPCQWLYKLIGADEASLRQAVLEVVEVDEVTIERSNTSSGGNYVSLNVEVRVCTEHERTGIYDALRAHRSVRMVL
ncbi:MAG TPA: DUF493 domain-containing protein [Acidobacteriota bacterium]|nr:DUF493 domain-containing protein [Acidobacteriota bacterium]